MSRGLGRQQRAILEELETVPDGGFLLVSAPGCSRSDAEAARRAARLLEGNGTIRLGYRRWEGRSRLVVFPS